MKVSKDNAEHYVWGGTCDGWRLVDHHAMSVIHERMPPGSAEIRHYHQQARQFFFVLKGEATLEIDGETFLVQCGEGVEVSPPSQHQMRNDSNAEIEFLVVSTPTTRGDRVVGAR